MPEPEAGHVEAGPSDAGHGEAEHAEADLTPLGRLLRGATGAATAVPDADAEAALEELLPSGPERIDYLWRFAALILLSASIAAFGLLADSAGVVIGAMLVAPLMSPILAAAAATVRADNRDLLVAVLVIALGTALAIAVGYVVSFVAGDAIPGTPLLLPGEVQARTFPGLLDLGIAVAAGAAAGYIVPRRSAVSALPGVGIAVALVPPLATVGITWQLGQHDKAVNALLLFLTNLAAIVFSASVMLLLAGFRPHVVVSRRRLAGRILVTLAAVTLVAVPLTIHTRSTIRNGHLNQTVSGVVADWDPAARIVSISADTSGGVAHVELLLTGPNDPDRVWWLADEIRNRFGAPVELDLRYQQDDRFQVTAR